MQTHSERERGVVPPYLRLLPKKGVIEAEPSVVFDTKGLKALSTAGLDEAKKDVTKLRENYEVISDLIARGLENIPESINSTQLRDCKEVLKIWREENKEHPLSPEEKKRRHRNPSLI